MNVFDIVKQYDLLMAELEDNGGELTPELATALTVNKDELDKKVHAYHFIIKTKEAEIQLAKDEQQRLMNVRKSKEGVIEKLKNLVDLAVETFGVYKPKAVNKSLTFSDLSVSQKKTEALEIDGEIDDERFCRKQLTITLSYEDTKKFNEQLRGTEFYPTETIIVDNAKLKEWLIDNEEEHKNLLYQYKEKMNSPNTFFDEMEVITGDKPVDETKILKEKDISIVLKAKINHNSTVIFR
jgi:hypothetical protein